MVNIPNPYHLSICIFYNKSNNHIIVQERGKHSKMGEKYGLWGGGFKEGENAKQALLRELQEELEYTPKELQYLGEYTHLNTKESDYKGLTIVVHIFLSPITNDLRKCKILEGVSQVEMHIDDAIQSTEFMEGNTDIFKKIKEEFLNNV